MKFNKKITLLTALIAAYFTGCGGGGGGGVVVPPVNNKPGLEVSVLNGYEGLTKDFTVKGTDSDGVASAQFSYNDGVSHDVGLAQQGVVGDVTTYGGTLPAFVVGTDDNLGAIPYEAKVTDSKGAVTSVAGSFDRFMDESNGDLKLEDVLADSSLQNSDSNGIFTSYAPGHRLELGGAIFFVGLHFDAMVRLNDGRRVVVWYQGELDGDHASLKAEFDSFVIPYIECQGCKPADLLGKLQAAKTANWSAGEY